MFALSSFAEMTGYSLSFLNEKFKRKKIFMIFAVLSGVTCLAVALIQFIKDSDDGSIDLKIILLIIFTFLGKTTASGAYNSSFVYTSLMFPTRVRNSMILFCDSIGSFGAILSPEINLLGEVVLKQLPYLLFSLLSFVGFIFIVILPDPSSLNYLD